MKRHLVSVLAGASLLTLIGAGLGSGSAQEATPVINPSDFSPDVTNPFFPLPVGIHRVYEGTETDPDTGETVQTRVEETVLPERAEVAGVTVAVLHVSEFADGEQTEVTRDYHAQHADGSVWYFGEDVDQYEDGQVVGHEGSWLAGEGENQASEFLPADPQVFDTIQQEQAPGLAEDFTTVVEVGVETTTPAGTFSGCIRTVDVDPLEMVSEFKTYCPGAGLVREEGPEGVTELVSIEEAAGATPVSGTPAST
jgi:hypothetical protein